MDTLDNNSIGIYFKNLLTRKFLLVFLSFVLLICNAVMDIGIDQWVIVSITAGFVGGNSVEHLSNRNRTRNNPENRGLNHE